MTQGVKQALTHCLVVAAGVADVGEDLRQRLLVVDFNEMPVLGQVFLVFIKLIYRLRRVVLIGLVVDKSFQRQTVALRRILVGPADGKRGDWHHQLGKLQDVDDELRLINGGAKVAVAQPFLIEAAA